MTKATDDTVCGDPNAYWNLGSNQWALMKSHLVSFLSPGQLLKHGAARGVFLISAPSSSWSNIRHTLASGQSGVSGYALHDCVNDLGRVDGALPKSKRAKSGRPAPARLDITSGVSCSVSDTKYSTPEAAALAGTGVTAGPIVPRRASVTS
ncbi:hypothetical protein VTK73DRAFT_9233 [Phialemonium thermophilum]|uniref:Uncharacterized protein n=1 Tax=Phialemonium thermophilum TaxID=223376 RepID=A0ABR3W3M7_9PEZI